MTSNNIKPDISVIMSVYNGELYLKEAIESILNQSYINFEFIIINDGSTDNSHDICLDFKEKDTRIIYITQENKGLCFSLNLAIKNASGKYIARMDSDDISLENRLLNQKNFLDSNLNIDVLGSRAIVIDSNGNKKQKIKPQTNSDDIFTGMFFENQMIHPSVMFRREILQKKCLFYDESFKVAQDYNLWSKLLNNNNFANLQSYELLYRIHNSSVSETKRTTQDHNARKIRMFLLGKHFSEIFTLLTDSYFNSKIDIEDIKIIEDEFNVIKNKNNISTKVLCSYFYLYFYYSPNLNLMMLCEYFRSNYFRIHPRVIKLILIVFKKIIKG